MPETIPFMDLPGQHAPLKDELLAVVSEALDTARFIGGPQLESLEAEFAAFTGAAHCAGVGSGTDALRLALQALGVGPGDLVLTAPNTFIATTEAVSQAGARFEFVDVEPDTCLMDPQAVADLLAERFDRGRGPRPAALLPVHLYGQCCDMDALSGLAERYGLKVLEDAAQAHGAACKGRGAGTLGQAAAFSFYPGKNLGACGEAGAVTTSDEGLIRTVRMLRDHGQERKYHHALEGSNARLDAIQAGFLRVKLRRLPAWNQARRDLADRYDAAFASLPGVRPVAVRPGNTPARHLYVIHVDDREGLARRLAEHHIQTGLHYPLPLHLQPCYAHLGLPPGSFPHAERSAATLLSLPLFPEMTAEQADRVIAAVAGFVGA